MKNLIKSIPALFLFSLLFSSCDKNNGLFVSSTDSVSLDGTYDKIQSGVWLLMNYDAASESFVGTIENVEQETMENISLKIELSESKEVVLSQPFDLVEGEMKTIRLPSNSEVFNRWTPVIEYQKSTF